MSEIQVRESINEILSATLFLDKEVDPRKTFKELGMDSITGVEFIKSINRKFTTDIKLAKIYDYPTTGDFSAFIYRLLQEESATGKTPEHSNLSNWLCRVA